MFVGVCRLTFHLYGVSSLKGKRQVMRRIIERTRVKFNASVAEVADNDAHKQGVVGFAVVGNDKAHVDAMMSSVLRFIDQLGVAPVAGIETEVISMKGDIGNGSPLEARDCQDSALFDKEMTEDDFDEEEKDSW